MNKLKVKHDVWIEKYRPKKLKNIVGQTDIVTNLKHYVESGNLPHLLFSGPPGVGKTAAAICIARELYGKQWINNFVELNASDERGIDVVRNKIKNTATTVALGDAEFKIILLDEGENLTSDSQSALRRTMEKYSASCRFIISTNFSSKIIGPIQSRCAVYRFKPLSKEDIVSRIKYICEQEGHKITNQGMESIIYIADGDMRRAINALQAASSIDKSKTINSKMIYASNVSARPEDIIKLVNYSISGEFINARKELDNLIITKGISGDDIINQLFKTILSTSMNNKLKMQIINRLGETDFRISEGANERIQLEALIAYFNLKSKIKEKT